MRHRANTSVAPYCHLFNTVATAYNGESSECVGGADEIE